jgi:hypothetical protein
MDWNGLEWTGMDWNGLEWTGMDWNGLEWARTEIGFALTTRDLATVPAGTPEDSRVAQAPGPPSTKHNHFPAPRRGSGGGQIRPAGAHEGGEEIGVVMAFIAHFIAHFIVRQAMFV